MANIHTKRQNNQVPLLHQSLSANGTVAASLAERRFIPIDHAPPRLKEQPMSEIHGTCAVTIVPASEGRAFRVRKGDHIRIETPHGAQAADFFAFNVDNVGEWFSANHTWVTTFNVKPREGDVLLSRFRRPMLEFSTDGAGGVHDMMIAACDQFRYEFFGHKGPHPSCSENLHLAMRRLGHTIDVVPQPINFFTNTRVEADGSLVSPPNPVSPRSFVELEALMELICVVSSCPFDLPVDGWRINATGGPTELVVSVGEC